MGLRVHFYTDMRYVIKRKYHTTQNTKIKKLGTNKILINDNTLQVHTDRDLTFIFYLSSLSIIFMLLVLVMRFTG